jgi:hypothetical protein
METLDNFQLLLTILRADAAPHQYAINEQEWNEIVKLSFAHGIATMLLQRLEESGSLARLPSDARSKLISEKFRIAIENTRLYVELADVLRAFRAADVAAAVLKGAHLAELVYPNVSLRPMDDIDLLVKESDLKTAEAALLQLGYAQHAADAERMKSNNPHHLTPFTKAGCKPIEIHWILPSMDLGWIERAWERVQRVDLAGVPACALSPEDLLLHLAVHASLHHRFGIGLRPLCDIAAATARYNDTIRWEMLHEQSLHWRVANATYLTLLLASDMVGASVPARALDVMVPRDFDLALVDWAKGQIVARAKEISDSSAVSPRLARFWTNSSIAEMFRQALRVAFPSPRELARTRSESNGNMLIAYALHWKRLLVSRGAVLWRLLARDKDTLASAAIYRKLTDQ